MPLRLTDEQLQELERRYRPKAIPPCPECGGPLIRLGPGERYGCQAARQWLDTHDAGPAREANVRHIQVSRWDKPPQWDDQVAALIQEVRESRLPGNEQLDLVTTDTAQEVLRTAYRELAALASLPDRHRDLVLETIARLRMQWGDNMQEAHS